MTHKVVGPCLMFCNPSFDVFLGGSEEQVGKVQRRFAKKSFYTDASNFAVEYPSGTPSAERVLLLAATALVNLTVFERAKEG